MLLLYSILLPILFLYNMVGKDTLGRVTYRNSILLPILFLYNIVGKDYSWKSHLYNWGKNNKLQGPAPPVHYFWQLLVGIN